MFTIELTKYLILRKINAHFEFDDSSPSQDPGTGRASINIWELRRPAVRSQRQQDPRLMDHRTVIQAAVLSTKERRLGQSQSRGVVRLS